MKLNYKRNLSCSFAQKLGVLVVVAFYFAAMAVAKAQAPAFAWAQQFGSPGGGWANAVATDASDNVYVAGYFSSTNLTFGTTTLTNNGSADCFLVKYDPKGNAIWARQTGGSGSIIARNLHVDKDGSIYIAGDFSGGNFGFGSSTLTNTSGRHCFLMKYDNSGNPVWAAQSSGNGNEYGKKITADAMGNVYIIGEFRGTNCTFGTNIFDTSQNSPFGSDIFVVKYDQQGQLLWAKRAISPSNDTAGGIGVDTAGNCYVAGTFANSSMTFEDITLNQTGDYNVFLAKYDSQGNLIWAKGAGGIGLNIPISNLLWGNALAVDSAGNSYLAGVLGGDTSTFGNIAITNNGGDDMFVAKYDSAGNILWATNYGGTGYEGAFDITLDSANGLYVLGGFISTNSIFGNTTLTNNSGHERMFITKFDTNGSPIWAQQTTGSGNLTGPIGITVDSQGNTYTVGIFNLTVAFGNATLSSAESYAMFVAKLDGPPLLKTTITSGQLILTWPAYQTGFVLESTSSPSGNATWMPVTNIASIIGDQCVVTDEISGTSKFYRLRKP